MNIMLGSGRPSGLKEPPIVCYCRSNGFVYLLSVFEKLPSFLNFRFMSLISFNCIHTNGAYVQYKEKYM